MAGRSSATISVADYREVFSLENFHDRCPERSARSPGRRVADGEAAAVRTEAQSRAGHLPLLPRAPVVTLGFVQHAQPFHQQALGIEVVVCCWFAFEV